MQTRFQKVQAFFIWIAANKFVVLFFIVFLTIYLIAWNRGLTILYLISELSLSILLLSWVLPYFNLLGIQASISHPQHCHQEERIDILFSLDSSSFLSRYFLELWCKLPFSQQKEHMFFISQLKGKHDFKVSFVCDVRGVHKIGPLSIRTGFPLGVKEYVKIYEEDATQLIVYPKPIAIHNFSFSVDESSMLQGDYRSERKGGHDEFMAVREYRPGDSPRYIHWPISAKHGELMVREYHESLSPSLVIVLDLHKDFDVGEGKHTTLEYAVKIAASLAIFALDKGYRVSLFGYGQESLELHEVVGANNHLRILEALAYVKSDGEQDYQSALNHFLSFHQTGGTLILFDNGSSKVENQLDLFSSYFFKPVLFDIQANSFTSDDLNEDFLAQEGPRQSIYTLQKGCDFEKMFT